MYCIVCKTVIRHTPKIRQHLNVSHFSYFTNNPDTNCLQKVGIIYHHYTFNVVIIVVVVERPGRPSKRPSYYSYILCKKTSHLTHFEHFAADNDRPQPLYDRFTGKLAPSTLLLVNVLTEKGCRSRFRKKKSEETQELQK